MNKNTEKAKQILLKDGYTCVLIKGDKTLTSRERGVKPLLNFLDNQIEKGYYSADKVVGKSAAMLYVLLGVREIFASVMSVPATQILKDAGINYFCESLVDRIENRAKNGFCPMEEAVLTEDNPKKGLLLIKNKLKELNAN